MSTTSGSWLDDLRKEIEKDFKLAYKMQRLGAIESFSWKELWWLRIQSFFGFVSHFTFTDEEAINGQVVRKTILRGYKTRSGRIYVTKVEG